MQVFKDFTLNNLSTSTSLKIPVVRELPHGIAGQIVFYTATGLFYFHDGISWQAVSGGLFVIEQDGVLVDPNVNAIDFTGAGVTVTQTSSGQVQVQIADPASGSPWTLDTTTEPPNSNFVQNTAFPGVAFGENNLLFGSDQLDSGGAKNVRTFFVAQEGMTGLGSFRAGVATGTQWDSDRRGEFSTAFGIDNVAGGTGAFIGGGTLNTASGTFSTVLGGIGNSATGYGSTVLSGQGNQSLAYLATIFTGQQNTAGVGGQGAFIGTGKGNQVHSVVGVITGGLYSTITYTSMYENAIFSFIGNGFNNTCSGPAGFIGNGVANTTSGNTCAVVSGRYNTALSNGPGCALVGSGASNTVNGFYSTILGGRFNSCSGNYSNVLCGANNIANGNYSSIINGKQNTVTTGTSYSCIASAAGVTLDQSYTTCTKNLRVGSTIAPGGGVQFQSVQTVTTDPVTATFEDHTIILDSGAGTLFLPLVPVQGQRYYIIARQPAAAGAFTIHGNGQTIFDNYNSPANGPSILIPLSVVGTSSTAVLGTLVLLYTGTEWYTI